MCMDEISTSLAKVAKECIKPQYIDAFVHKFGKLRRKKEPLHERVRRLQSSIRQAFREDDDALLGDIMRELSQIEHTLEKMQKNT